MFPSFVHTLPKFAVKPMRRLLTIVVTLLFTASTVGMVVVHHCCAEDMVSCQVNQCCEQPVESDCCDHEGKLVQVDEKFVSPPQPKLDARLTTAQVLEQFSGPRDEQRQAPLSYGEKNLLNPSTLLLKRICVLRI